MANKLFPYGDVRNSDIVAKNGVHSAEKKMRSRVVGGRAVKRIERLSA